MITGLDLVEWQLEVLLHYMRVLFHRDSRTRDRLQLVTPFLSLNLLFLSSDTRLRREFMRRTPEIISFLTRDDFYTSPHLLRHMSLHLHYHLTPQSQPSLHVAFQMHLLQLPHHSDLSKVSLKVLRSAFSTTR